MCVFLQVADANAAWKALGKNEKKWWAKKLASDSDSDSD